MEILEPAAKKRSEVPAFRSRSRFALKSHGANKGFEARGG